VKRVLVLGLPGSGKSHLARLLAEQLDVKLVHLDRLFATPSGTNESRPEWNEVMEELILAPEWIIDGHYTDSLPIRLRAADTIIFVDTPVWLCLIRVWRRQGKARTDWPDHVHERRDREFYKLLWYTWTERSTIVDEVYDGFETHAGKARLIHLSGRRAVKRLTRRLATGASKTTVLSRDGDD
jgi:adenylate kinase family enzyme